MFQKHPFKLYKKEGTGLCNDIRLCMKQPIYEIWHASNTIYERIQVTGSCFSFNINKIYFNVLMVASANAKYSSSQTLVFDI